MYLANKTDRHDITELLLKVVLNTITLTHTLCIWWWEIKILDTVKMLESRILIGRSQMPLIMN